MAIEKLTLDSEPAGALTSLLATSKERPVLVFKRSPICPVSFRAEGQLEAWVEALDAHAEVALAIVDVLNQRPLARGLTAELDVRHESPQALWLVAGQLAWHGSHDDLTQERFDELLRDYGRDAAS